MFEYSRSYKFVDAILVSAKGLEMKLSQLLSPCLFGHGHLLRTRDEEGHLALQCADCGQSTRVLTQPAIKGPKHHAAPVKGAPLVRAMRIAAQRSYPRSA